MVVRYVAIAGMAIALCAACRSPAEKPAEACLSIATGGPEDVSYAFGAALARLFDERALGLCIAAELTDGSSFNVMALQDASADFALARADTVYWAYVSGTPLRARPHGRLRGIAVLFGSVLHMAVIDDGGVRDWTALRNKPVGLSVFSDTDRSPVVGYPDLVAAAGDFGPRSIDGRPMRIGDLTKALASGQISSGFVLSAYPVTRLRTLARDSGIRLLDIEPDAAMRIRARYPFFKPAVVPQATYPGQRTAVKTVAVDNLLVTREDLDDDAVYTVTKALFENLPDLAHDHEALLQVNPDQASATPIPLHPGAARYYRERELLR